MRHLLDELIDNAIKFNRDGGSVTLRATPAKDGTVIEVIDTGIGIAEADRAGLFQPFVQVDAALNRKYGGAGLGLALALRIARMHGGTIEVQSEPGQGSTLRVCLPQPGGLPRPVFIKGIDHGV